MRRGSHQSRTRPSGWLSPSGRSRICQVVRRWIPGSAGGKIRTGRFIDYGTTKKDNNQMLVSIAQAMGASDVTSFGDPSGATGPLPNLA